MTEETKQPEAETAQDPKPEAKPQHKAPLSAGLTDNPIVNWFVGLFAGAFFVALILWTASLTLGIMEIVLPHNPTAKWYSLALFDGGVIVWLGMYVYKAKGTPQRAVSLLMTVIDFMGVMLMVTGGVYLGGQDLKAIPEWIAGTLVNGVIFATLANVAAAYYFKASDPDTREAIQAQSLEDTLTEEAMKQARANVEREARQLGAIMARRATARIKYRLALPMSENERAEWDGETIEAETIEAPQLPAPTEDIPAWLLGIVRFFGVGRKQPQPQNADTTTTNSNDSN